MKLLVARVAAADSKNLRDMVDQLRDRMGSGAVVLGCADGSKVSLLAGVTKDLVGKLHAGNLVRELAVLVGGKGGGRPDFAQAGGNRPEQLDAAFVEAERTKGRPTVIIANTVKGKGAVLMENKASWHHHLPTREEYALISRELAERKEALKA